jgi:hypothetical protein
LSALHRTKSGQAGAGVLGGLLDTAITLSSTPVSRPVPSSTPTAVKGECRQQRGFTWAGQGQGRMQYCEIVVLLLLSGLPGVACRNEVDGCNSRRGLSTDILSPKGS